MRKLFFLTLALACTLSSRSAPGQEGKEKSAEELKVMAAVYRYQTQQCSHGRAGMTFFVGVYDGKAEKDPPTELVEKLNDGEPKVKKYSEMDRSGKNNEFADRESGGPAVLLSVEKLKWKSDTEAEVQGSCGYAEWAAQGYSYTVVSEGARWGVKDARETWVF